MLAPYVLRNIVLPHLRSTICATTTSADYGSSASRASISTSVRQARAAEALVAEREGLRWEAFEVRTPDLPRAKTVARDVREVRQDRTYGREEAKDGYKPLLTHERRARMPGPSDMRYTGQHKPTQPSSDASSSQARQLPVSALDGTTPCARSELPPAIAKLLHAKLFRLAVFRILDTPEHMSDAALVAHVVHVLEKQGAGKLARRLYKAFEAPARTADGRLRLMSEPSPPHKRPPDYWRMPLVPRPLDAFPEPTRQERLTHAHNLTITRLLTVTHPIPYTSPFPHTRRPPLRRLRDVLHHVEELRRHRGFVPDRVTANIVVKAWLSCLARTTSRGQQRGLSREDLRDIFQLVSDSFESKSNPLDVPGQTKGKPKKADTDKKATSASTASAGPPVFDPRVDYERHVQPFAKMMIRAMVRVGDHSGRKRVEAWAAEQAKKLGVEGGGVHASRVKKKS